MELEVFRYDAAMIEALKRVYGDEYRQFLEAIARPSKRLYVRVNTLKIDPGELIDMLRARGIEVYRDEELEEAIYFPVKGPFKITLHDKVVVADKKASESVYLGANLYVPGVKDCDPSIKRGDVVTIVNELGFAIAEGVAVIDCETMKRRSRGLAVKVLQSMYSAPRIRELPEFEKGFIYPQSLPAMYTARILDPQPGELIVDMCAAPGGKAGHIVELTRGRAIVLAFDHSKRKIKEMHREMKRLGHEPLLEIWRADSRYLDIDFPWLRPHRILLDPPCTALGVRPKLYDEKKYSDVVSSFRYQEQFLRVAIKTLRPGGILVYSTCTVTVEENEMLIEKILSMSRCLEVEEISIKRASKGVYGRYRESYIRFHPHIHDVTGYFIAKIRKRCDSF